MKLTNSLSSFSYKSIKESFSTRDFSKSVGMMIAMLIPIIIAVSLGNLEIGIFVCLGVLFTSFSDTVGNLRLKIIGMLLTGLMAIGVTYILHLLKIPAYIFIPVLGILIFCISYLSVYGFRASLISFAGLFTIVLNMSNLSDTDLSIYTRLPLLAVGTLWYIVVVVVRHLLFPKSVTEYYLIKTMEKTAEYIKVRADLIKNKDNRKELIKELLDLQESLTENHETLRDLLISRRRGSGKSFYQIRRLMIFQQLVDILELSMTNPVNYRKMDLIFDRRTKQLDDFRTVLLQMSNQLQHIAKYFSRPRKIKKNNEIHIHLEQIKEDVLVWAEEENKYAQDDLLSFKNYWKYIQTQFNKIKKIEFLLKESGGVRVTRERKKDHSFFLTKEDYRFNVLVENFHMHSTIFRHSVRIAVVGMVGYAIGLMFNIENAYWILMTIFIIMRANYGLTKERFKNRSIGTVIGGAVSFLLIYFIRSDEVYAVLAILWYVIGFSMIQRNYKAAAAFITMHVLFIYALLKPGVFEVIQYRVLDTLIGAGLAYGANHFLWPSWEIKSIDKTLKSAINDYRAYLKNIAKYYNEKGEMLSEYKLSRKQAFLALSDLNASFQRMNQEPKTQHKNLNEVFQIVMLMHSFLASLASFGTYISNNPTTPATKEFNEVIKDIENNLALAEKILDGPNPGKVEVKSKKQLDDGYKSNLKKIANQEKLGISWKESSAKEEAHLVIEQFKWLLANSSRMTKILQRIKFQQRP